MNREEAIAKFKNCKFFVETVKKSADAQRVLFSLGFKWKSGDTHPCNLDSPLLLVEDGVMYWASLPSWDAEDVERVSVDDIIEGYVSKRAKRNSRKHDFEDGQIIFSPEYQCIAVYRGTNKNGGLMTDTFMFLDGEKLKQVGGDITSGIGYTASYKPASDEQQAQLGNLIHKELESMKEKVSKLASVK